MNTYLSEEQMKGELIVIDAMGKNNFQQIQAQAHDILLKERMGKQSGLVSVHGKIVKQPRKYVIINHLQIISPCFTLFHLWYRRKNTPRKSNDLQGEKMILHKTFTTP